MIPSIYLNLEDDVSRIVERVKKVKSQNLILVCPKRCFLFNDSINLRLLKKQVDLLGREVFILTMDEKGQLYATEAGFKLKFLPKIQKSGGVSDIKITKPQRALTDESLPEEKTEGIFETVKEIAGFSKKPKSPVSKNHEASNVKFLEPMPKVLVSDSVFPVEIKQSYELKKSKKRNQRYVTFLVAASLIIVLAVVFAVLPKATVIVYPKSEPLTRDMEISLSTHADSPDVNKLILPAKKIVQEMDVQDKFQSQGKKEVGNKAVGGIRIYNFTGQPINLKAATTVLSAGGKTYLLSEDVNLLKPTTYKNAATKEINESSLGKVFEIVAAEGGESSNLPAGTRMEITNQVFGSRPQVLYAKTETAVSGGTSRLLSVVSDQDMISSRNFLAEKALAAVRQQMAAEKLSFAEKSYILEIQNFLTDKPVGFESPNFTASMKVKITGLGFDANKLQNLVLDRISQTLSGDKTLEKKKNSFDNVKIKTLDLNGEIAVLLVHFEGDAVFNVNFDNIGPGLVGKNRNQVSEILKSNPEIDKIDITLSPSWQRNFPWFVQKITVVKGNIN